MTTNRHRFSEVDRRGVGAVHPAENDPLVARRQREYVDRSSSPPGALEGAPIRAAVIVPIVLGVGLILYSLFTRYELGAFKLITMPVNLVFDLAASAFLIASPFLFGFINQAPNAWLPHIAVGIAVIVVVAFSQPAPGPSVTATGHAVRTA